MFGDYLMVAPVFENSGEVQVYIPAGRWTRWFDSRDGGKAWETITGPVWVTESYDAKSIPLLVRERSILVLGRLYESRVEYNYLNDVEIRLYIHDGDSETERLVLNKHGTEVGYIKAGRGNITVSSAMRRYKVTDPRGRVRAE